MVNRTHSMVKLKRDIDEVTRRGGRVIDSRTRIGKALMAWRAQLVTDLGGPEELSTQQLAVVDTILRTKLFLDSVDCWLAKQPHLADRKKKALIPALMQRQALADALTRNLAILGLARAKQREPSLRDFLTAHDRGEKSDQLS
jgi:hypothetical protein